MDLQAVTGQLYVVDGTTMPTANGVPSLLAQSAPPKSARGRQRDSLFVHLVLGGKPEETMALTQDLVDSVSDVFYKTSGSVTAALRSAMTQTNKRLLSHNMGGTARVREGAITCAVLRGEELFMAQAGEAFALLGRNYGIERLPSTKPETISPIGRTAGLDLRYYHRWLQSGDTLLMAGPHLAHLPSTALEAVLIDSGVENGLIELRRITGTGSARAILVEFTDKAPRHLPDARIAMTPARRPEKPSHRQLPPPMSQPKRERSSQVADRPTSRERKRGSSIDVERVETSARKASSLAAISLSRFTGWLGDLLSKLIPEQQREERAQGWAVPALLAIVIPIVIGVIVTGVYVQRGRVVRLGEIKRDIQQNMEAAQLAAENDALAAFHYQAIIALADEGDQLRPGDDEIAGMRVAAMVGLDKIVGVARLTGELLYEYEPSSFMSSVSLGDDDSGGVYTLDAMSSRVYYHQTGEDFSGQFEEPEIILFSDQAVGSHVIDHIVDIMWRPQGKHVTRAGLAMLDRRGTLISFYPNLADSRSVLLALSSDWQNVTDMTSYNERLYVLDRNADSIWRYYAEGDGFMVSADQRTIEFDDELSLDQVIDLTIVNDDGSVILLFENGDLKRFANGRLLWALSTLEESGLESPMISPVAVKIVGRGLNSSIFVADPGSDRIIQLSLGGAFLAQYKAIDEQGSELFSRANDFAVTTNPLRIYAVTDEALYLVTQS